MNLRVSDELAATIAELAKTERGACAHYTDDLLTDRLTMLARIAELDTKCLDLIADVDRLEFFREEREKKIAELEQKLEAAEVALVKSREELSRTEGKLCNANEEIDRLQTQVEDLEAETTGGTDQ